MTHISPPFLFYAMCRSGRREKPDCGFTLLEVALVVFLMSSLVYASIPVYQLFQVRNDLDVTTQELVQMLRRAQTFSRAGERDDNWGVSATGTVITLFRGADFLARDPAFDETVDIPSSITVSGLYTVIFDKLSGSPRQTGIITLTSSLNDTRSITVNEQGGFFY